MWATSFLPKEDSKKQAGLFLALLFNHRALSHHFESDMLAAMRELNLLWR